MPLTAVTDVLPQLCYQAGRLIGVEHALFAGDQPGGDRSFICGIRLTFESAVVAFRAVPEDDTITVVDGNSFLEADEVAAVVTAESPWAACVGHTVQWAWLLVNQQGYEDGVRLEFHTGLSGVDLIVAASAIRLYVFTAVGRPTSRPSHPGDEAGATRRRALGD